MTDRPLNPTAASLLGLLHQGPMTGWDLVTAVEQVIGNFWSITRSQVYRELAAMTADGLLEAGERGPRDRRPYAVTDAGRAAFASWLDREPAAETIRFPMLLTVLFGRHLPPERLAEFLERHRARHAERLAHYEQVWATATAGPGEPDPHAMAVLDFGRCYERAVQDWFARLPPELTGPAGPDGTPGRT